MVSPVAQDMTAVEPSRWKNMMRRIEKGRIRVKVERKRKEERRRKKNVKVGYEKQVENVRK